MIENLGAASDAELLAELRSSEAELRKLRLLRLEVLAELNSRSTAGAKPAQRGT